MWNVRNIKMLGVVMFLALSLLPKAAQAFIPQLVDHNRLIERSAESVQSVDKFTYDAVGNLLTASNDTAQLSFTYDAMDRLATANTMLLRSFVFMYVTCSKSSI